MSFSVPRRKSYVPKHRGPSAEPTLKKGIRKSVLFSGVAVAATGIAVSSGIVMQAEGPGNAAAAALASAKLGQRPSAAADSQPGSADPADPAALADRTRTASRSDRRTAVDAEKLSVLNQDSGGQVTQTEDLSSQDPRTIARAMLSEFGFSSDQFSCLDSLYMSESGWNIHADNPSSSAYGIPQALPGSKMSSAGSNWENNAATQIRWGLGYIKGSYGSPCGAWSFKQGHNWY
ncbi:MAG: lytic transglycosylase domain-containing protein [Nocardioidaceae bacterium]